MDDSFIITAYCIMSDTLKQLGHKSHKLAQLADEEILIVAVVAAKFFNNHHERTLCLMIRLGYIQALSVSRYNRRIHGLASLLEGLLELLTGLYSQQQVFVIDSMPLPVCRRVRARRCLKVRGKAFCGYCAAKKEKFYGWRLHLICDAQGVPVSYSLVEASFHDLTPLHELSYVLPQGAVLYGDKGYISHEDAASLEADTGVKLISPKRKNMTEENTLSEVFGLQRYRQGIETMNSQLESMGVQRLRARTNEGFFIKVKASLFALACTNLHELD